MNMNHKEINIKLKKKYIMTKNVSQILNELNESNSSKYKESILEKYKDNEDLMRFLYLAYSPRINFYVKKVSWEDSMLCESNQTIVVKSLSDCMHNLERLYTRAITGNKAKDYANDLLYRCSDRNALQKIFDRDIKCNVSVKLINKIFGKDFIEETPYMGAVSYSEKAIEKLFKKSGKAFSEIKYDGKYSNCYVNDEELYFESRSGEEQVFLKGKFIDSIYNNAYIGHVLNGELLVKGFDRLTANGILNSISSINIKKRDGEDTSKEEAKFLKETGITLDEAQDRIVYIIWDVVPEIEFREGFCSVNRYDRIKTLESMDYDEYFQMCEYKIVNSVDEAKQDLKEKLAAGLEGTIIKAYDAPWKDGKDANLQIKLKVEFDLDLKIVGFETGRKGTKFENTLGTILLESEDGLLRTGCGSGLDEKSGIREEIWNNQEKYLGNICVVKCNGLSKNRQGGNSLLFPVYQEIRTDKNIANTFQECLDAQDAALALKKI